jgi:hypothetical protein
MHTFLQDTTAYISYHMLLYKVRSRSRGMFQSFRHFIGTHRKSTVRRVPIKRRHIFWPLSLTQALLSLTLKLCHRYSRFPSVSHGLYRLLLFPSLLLWFLSLFSPIALHLKGKLKVLMGYFFFNTQVFNDGR